MQNLPRSVPEQLGMDRIVQLAHRHLRVDFVCATELTEGKLSLRAAAGKGCSSWVGKGNISPALGSLGQLLIEGAIPNLIADTSSDPRARELPINRDLRIGSFIGVRLVRSDGSIYGVLSGISRRADHSLDDRDVRFLLMLGELLVPHLDEQLRLQRLQVDLGRLIEEDDVAVAYQPIVDVRSRRCLGVEALARFPKPFGRPDETIAAAYEVGLGLELERLVVRKAWPLLETLKPDQFLTMNLTPGALLQLAPRATARAELCLKNLVVEMTENDVVDSYGVLRAQLEPLRRRGLRVGIDDAGAGYASLRHVVELRPEIIKIDRSLIDGVADDRARRMAVSAFVLLALDLGAMVVAEGVERAEDLAAVADLGVHAAQGYLLAKPSTNHREVARWLRLPQSQGGHDGDVESRGERGTVGLQRSGRRRPTTVRPR
jgi:EAL domain-containing protein (putative c-di-GMP-specific phosphodiesterase class I)